jgi:Tfp pilus assembly protein PilO
MGFLALLFVIMIVLAVLGLGWQTFSSGVITGFDKAVDVGIPIIKNLTQEARDYMNNPTAKDYLRVLF